MKSEFFLRALSDVDPKLIAEAASPPKRSFRGFARKYGVLAACLLLVATVGICLPFLSSRAGLDDSMNENEAAADRDDNGIYDTVENIAMDELEDWNPTEMLFRYCESGVWRTETISLAGDGAVPAAVTLLNLYLSACGTDVRCVSATVETIGESDRVTDGMVEHTVGHRMEVVTLDGNPGEDVLRGMVNTILYSEVFYPDSVQILGPDGALSIDGEAPATGFTAFPENS